MVLGITGTQLPNCYYYARVKKIDKTTNKNNKNIKSNDADQTVKQLKEKIIDAECSAYGFIGKYNSARGNLCSGSAYGNCCWIVYLTSVPWHCSFSKGICRGISGSSNVFDDLH